MRKLTALLTAILIIWSPAAAIAAEDEPVDAHSDEAEHEIYMMDSASSVPGATFFNESSGCDEPSGAKTPATTTNYSGNRSIPSNHQVRGPWGDFFGRDYGDVSKSMVRWTVPMSGGKTILVHERAHPAFQLVAEKLAAHQAQGRYYSVRMASGWVWRRIGGSYRMSTHAFGTTIDINWDTNPYKSNNDLITDMPEWFVQAWRDSGFCWGGDWMYLKDTMHFAWKGPAATPGYGDLPKPYAPNTSKEAFTDTAWSSWSGFVNAGGGEFLVADGNRDGAPDLLRMREYGNGIQLSFARSSMDFRRCGITSYTVHGARGADEYIVADYDGDARPDLWAIDTSGTKIRIEAYTYASGYRDKRVVNTGATPRSGAVYLAGDYDRDGELDLYIVTRGADTRVEVWNRSDRFATRLVSGISGLNSKGAWQFSIGDDDVDGRDDVVAISTDGAVRLRTMTAKNDFDTVAASSSTAATATAGDRFAIGDLDGDGRGDLWQVSKSGRVTVRRGGNSTLNVSYWYQTPGWSCGRLSPADPWDFDGDSFHDMALASPAEDIDTTANAGAVNVIYGSKDGPVVDNDDLFYQDQAAIEGLSERGDRFGGAMTSGDFDHDGYADLAVAAPSDDVGPIVDGGLVNVIMGTSSGLGTADGQLWHRDTTGVLGTAGAKDRFGAALASGDFNSDGFYDLAIGAPGANVDGKAGAGSVNVLYGSKSGLTSAGDQLWHQNRSGILGVAGAGDRFGTALAVGDFNRDGFHDLAIGAPGDEVSGLRGAGQIHVIYGSEHGLTSAGDDRVHQDSSGILEVAGKNDRFGSALVAGDFNGDGYSDLGVGVPKEDAGKRKSIGKVNVLFGGPGGVAAGGNEVWSQATARVGDKAQQGDRFGAALAAGDFDDDGFCDLVVGVPGEDVGTARNAGGANVLYGRRSGLVARTENFIAQGRNGLVGAAETGDRFGAKLLAVDVDGSERWDLIVGIPGEDLAAVDAGAVILINGTRNGLKMATGTVWHQDTAGIAGTVETGDGFGHLS